MRWRPPWRRERPPDAAASPGGEVDRHREARIRMVRDQLAARGMDDAETLGALAAVPRHLFVSSDEPEPYGDRALPVGSGQTISQPYVVAMMTSAGRPPGGWAGASVLEIGTGSGYQAAVLAELGADVVSVERHPELAHEARRRLAEAGYADRVRVEVGDGTLGWPAGAPYRSILVTAAGPLVPPPLLSQLERNGGRLVMPVGSREHQMLTLVERHDDELALRELDPVVFVPLIGEYGWAPD